MKGDRQKRSIEMGIERRKRKRRETGKDTKRERKTCIGIEIESWIARQRQRKRNGEREMRQMVRKGSEKGK